MRDSSSAAGIFAVYGVLILSFFTALLEARPSSDHTLFYNDTLPVASEYPVVERRADDFWLRIMPLGASITAGDQPPPDDKSGNGYRKYVRDTLREAGWKVNMVGSFQSGTMADRDHEGVSGERVAQVNTRAVPSISQYRPNVVLINAGTNDATQNRRGADDPEHVDTTHIRMEDMITNIYSILGDDVVVVLSTLLPNTRPDVPGIADIIKGINGNYRALYRKLLGAGRKIILAEMNDGKFITNNDIHDHTHPTSTGQKKMAAVWLHAINAAEKKGWLVPPQDSGIPDEGGDFTCEKKYGSGNNNERSGWQVLSAANPLISDDGPYQHKSQANGKIYDEKAFPDTKYYFANIAKTNPNAEWHEALDDLILVTHQPDYDDRRKITWYQNLGGGKLEYKGELDVSDGCISRGIRWGDVDGDGLDDFICISRAGEMFVSRNLGGNPPKFEWMGQARGVTGGYRQENVRLGDIDGDGRLDYCVIGFDGNVRCWRNGGVGKMPSFWQDLGPGKPAFTAKGMGDIRGVRFVDVNGDGRADWVWLDKTGRSTIYINQRGSDKSLIPHWMEAASSHGGGFTLDDGGSREDIQFGRLYGSGRADYMYISRGACATEISQYYPDRQWKECYRTMSAWENLGSGGRFQKGDGAFWGDMRNRGVDDYIWISPGGVINVFPNQNTKEDTTRDASRGIWGGVIRALETGMDRRALHIGDWDGDGHDDVIAVDKWKGSLTIWITKWQGGKFSFTKKVIDRNDLCKQGWGIGYFDNGHHFVDISGDGRVDYLCMEPNGRVTGWINHNDNDLVNVGQVKFSEDLDRANLQFADVNGDGKADMIWTDKFNGNARVWHNVEYLQGDDRVSGSKFRWNHKGFRYLGSSRGASMHFPSLGGQGRADMVQVDPISAHGWCWFNLCPASGSADDDWKTLDIPAYTEIVVDAPELPDEIGDDEFCGGMADQWGKTLWNKMGMSTWLQGTIDYYESEGWPTTIKRDYSIPVVLSQYERRDEDIKWTWDPDCEDITTDGECSLAERDIKTDCVGRSRRAFTLWSSHNFAGFLMGYEKMMKDASLVTGFSLGDISKKFRHNEKDNSMEVSSILSLTNGIISTIAAMPISGPAGPALGALSGLFGLGTEIASYMTPERVDPRFDDWSNLSAQYGETLKDVLEKLQAYYKYAVSDPGEFLAVIGPGNFAAHTTGSPTWEVSLATNMARASVISTLWIQQGVFLVRYTKPIKLPSGDTFDFCGSGSKDGQHGWKEASHCAGNNVNYAILRWSAGFETSVRSSFGQDDDSLRTYDFTRTEVFDTSWTIQDRLKAFGPNRQGAFVDLLNYVIKNNQEVPQKDLVQWTIPVCNWDEVNVLNANCGDKWDCLHKVIIKSCQEMHYGESQAWPYKYLDI